MRLPVWHAIAVLAEVNGRFADGIVAATKKGTSARPATSSQRVLHHFTAYMEVGTVTPIMGRCSCPSDQCAFIVKKPEMLRTVRLSAALERT